MFSLRGFGCLHLLSAWITINTNRTLLRFRPPPPFPDSQLMLMLKSFGELALIQKLKITWYEQTWHSYWALVISVSKNPIKFTTAYKTRLTNPQLITWWVIWTPKVIIQIGNNCCSCTWLFRDTYPLISVLKQLGKKLYLSEKGKRNSTI